MKRPQREKPPPPTTNYGLEFGSKSLNAAFSNLSAMLNGFIGVPHLRVVAKLLGYQGIAAVLEELLVLAKSLINEPVKAHVRKLLQLAPKSCKLPRYDYGSEGVLQYYIHHTRDFAMYAPLRREWCQMLRELGTWRRLGGLSRMIKTGLVQETCSRSQCSWSCRWRRRR